LYKIGDIVVHELFHNVYEVVEITSDNAHKRMYKLLNLGGLDSPPRIYEFEVLGSSYFIVTEGYLKSNFFEATEFYRTLYC